MSRHNPNLSKFSKPFLFVLFEHSKCFSIFSVNLSKLRNAYGPNHSIASFQRIFNECYAFQLQLGLNQVKTRVAHLREMIHSRPQKSHYDLAIIGGGIGGLMTAYRCMEKNPHMSFRKRKSPSSKKMPNHC